MFVSFLSFIIKYCILIRKYFNYVEKKPKKQREIVTLNTGIKQMSQKLVYEYYKDSTFNNCVTRQLQKDCIALKAFDDTTRLSQDSLKFKTKVLCCYGCNKTTTSNHPVYVFSCKECGNLFQENRHLSRNLEGYTSLIIGARAKLGHQIMIKLLKAGSTVVGTTRYPETALNLFKEYPEFKEWQSRLFFYPESFDLDVNNIKTIVADLNHYISSRFGKLDILVNSAAQTIRVREKNKETSFECNRYGDAKFVHEKYINSWQMRLPDLVQNEMEEVYRINAIAPTILVQGLTDLMVKSENTPYIINIHAREGLLNVFKNSKHIHTNMAKSALHMLTACLSSCNLKTQYGIRFSIHGICPGWLSVDEYYENNRPWVVPPLDEIDGAARALYPVFKELKSCLYTRRHFTKIIN